MKIDKKTRRAIEKECRLEAHEVVKQQYALYDAIWDNRIRITPILYDHGDHVVHDLVLRMPNLLTRSPYASPLDEACSIFGFATTSDLVEYLLAYKPRGPVEDRLYEEMLDHRLREWTGEELPPEAGDVDDVPF